MRQLDYSETYRKKLEAAILEAKFLGLPNQPSVTPRKHVGDDQLKDIYEYLLNDFYPFLYQAILPTYWGDKCQTLSSYLYARLIALGINADIVIGEVEVNGTLEFDTTLENIRKEYLADKHEGKQQIHAWITLGDDTIIDAGLPDRMIRHYRFPERYMPPIMVGRANDISEMFKARHDPLLVGADFISKTNSMNPQSLIGMFS